MGKLQINTNSEHGAHSRRCKDQDAPICGNQSCKRSNLLDEKLELMPRTPAPALVTRGPKQKKNKNTTSSVNRNDEPISVTGGRIDESVKELLIVGSGPHALTLLLRLLEPDPDFLSEEKRHDQAESKTKMRPINEVHRHVKDISRGAGTAANRKLKTKKKSNNHKNKGSEIPPPLSPKTVTDYVQVVDANGDWLASWKQNFKGIDIPKLRSLMNAHADPFDHRSLEFYAESHGRGDELVTLEDLIQRDKMFRGPYQVPSTSLFHDFHDKLVQYYGIQGIVQKGEVLSITPMPVKDQHNKECIFEVKIHNDGKVTTVRSKRCVCALGPTFGKSENRWEKDLQNEQGQNYHNLSRRILRCDEIIQWLLHSTINLEKQTTADDGKRLLIVGGGITSVQLVLRAINASWCKSIVFAQRSQKLVRHFDVENAWMGPKRGKLLKDFFSMTMDDRAQLLKDARKGGSIPPELVKELQGLEEKNPNLICKEEVQISQVEWIDEEFHVILDDGSTTNVDFIWLATGCENGIHNYPVLDNLCKTLPIDVINGLPVLSQDLSWSSRSTVDECEWKQLARKRIWCMGALAGLQLGADALNIVGARHGAVKVANAIRCDLNAISC